MTLTGEENIVRFEDVDSGDYSISFHPELGSRSRRVELNIFFNVPPMAGDWSDEPLDLGTIRELPPIKPGEVAPEFNAIGLDKKPMRLEDFRGKTLLLVVWNSHIDTFMAGDLPQLRAVHKAHGDDPNFVLLSLNADSYPGQLRPLLEKNDYPGRHGTIEVFFGSKFDQDYRFAQFPSIDLIDPDGKFLERGLRGKRIAEAVNRALPATK